MKTKALTPKLLAAAAAGTLFLSGCIRDESPTGDDSSSEGTVLVSGRVQGDAALGGSTDGAGAGAEGALVTVARIQGDGSLRTVSAAEVKTDAQGRFSISAIADGGRELIVRAQKGGREWKAVVSAKAEKGKTVACRPLDLESSLEADVLAKARAQADGKADGKASFADIASSIDAELAARAEAKPEAKPGFEAFLAAQILTQAQVRGAALRSGAGQAVNAVQARIDQAEAARMEAEAGLEADLDAAAGLSAEARADLEAGFRQAEHQAWIDAGVTLEAATAARESCYQAMAKAGAEAAVDAEGKALWLRKLALGHASDLEIAVTAGLKAQGGNEARIGSAVALGAALETSLLTAASGAAIDSAFLRFRSECAGLDIAIPGIASVSHAGNGSYVLTGKVEGGLSGADVQVAQVKPDGSLEIVAGTSGTTDAQGSFTLNADAKLNDSMLVIVTHDDQKLMVFVASADSSPVRIGTGSTEATAHILAGMESAAKAQGILSVTLGAGADSASARARSLELYAQALARFSADQSSAAGFRLAKAAHASASASLRVAAEASAKAAGASDASLQALAGAGASLQASIEASASLEAIAAAYEAYHAAVSVCLKSALALQASAWEKADAAVRAQGGARATWLARLAAAADAEAAAQAHLEFGAQVEAEAEAAFESGLAAPAGARMQAIVQALLLANMCG